jgi:hypothetical protein
MSNINYEAEKITFFRRRGGKQSLSDQAFFLIPTQHVWLLLLFLTPGLFIPQCLETSAA